MPGLSIRSQSLPAAALLLASALVSSGLEAAGAPDLAALQARANFQQRLDLYRTHQAYVYPGS